MPKWTLLQKPGFAGDSIRESIERSLPEGWSFSDVSGMGPDSLVFSVGGDGTALRAMRAAAEFGGRIVAIHAGTLGFLADFSAADIPMVVSKAVSGELSEDPRSLICVDDMDGQQCFAANELHFADKLSGNFHEWSFGSEGHDTSFFPADGLLASTPTGTTAYALSAGGSILHPWTPAIQMSALSPIPLAFRPCALPSNGTVTILVRAKRDGEIVVRADGITIFEKFLRKGEAMEFKVRECERKAIFLRDKKWCFFSCVSKKLGWGEIPGIPKNNQ